MAGSPYVYERQSEYWTSRQIEDYFLDLGFEVLTLPIPQNTENLIPADFIFFDKQRTKLFGLQYKALYKEKRDHWPVNKEQHKQIAHYDWIYYCFSELKSSAEHRTALHQIRIVDSGFEFREQVYPDGEDRLTLYSRWSAFYKNVERCKKGRLIRSPKHLQEVIMGGTDDPHLKRLASTATDIFLADFYSKHTVHFSPLMRNAE